MKTERDTRISLHPIDFPLQAIDTRNAHQRSSSAAIVEKGTAEEAPCAQRATSSKVKLAKTPPGSTKESAP
eukprot:scaffold230104_cov33-Tisochrysis_lutea.AAC.4